MPLNKPDIEKDLCVLTDAGITLENHIVSIMLTKDICDTA